PALLSDGGSYDGGGPTGGLLTRCDPASASYDTSDCARFLWAPGQAPSDILPVTLDGGGNSSVPSEQVVGKLFLGCLPDGGWPTAPTRYKVYALVSTSDPYAPVVTVPISAYVIGL